MNNDSDHTRQAFANAMNQSPPAESERALPAWLSLPLSQLTQNRSHFNA
jgi:hypothetical protein